VNGNSDCVARICARLNACALPRVRARATGRGALTARRSIVHPGRRQADRTGKMQSCGASLGCLRFTQELTPPCLTRSATVGQVDPAGHHFLTRRAGTLSFDREGRQCPTARGFEVVVPGQRDWDGTRDGTELMGKNSEIERQRTREISGPGPETSDPGARVRLAQTYPCHRLLIAFSWSLPAHLGLGRDVGRDTCAIGKNKRFLKAARRAHSSWACGRSETSTRD
jgi:hypothetical protein